LNIIRFNDFSPESGVSVYLPRYFCQRISGTDGVVPASGSQPDRIGDKGKHRFGYFNPGIYYRREIYAAAKYLQKPLN